MLGEVWGVEKCWVRCGKVCNWGVGKVRGLGKCVGGGVEKCIGVCGKRCGELSVGIDVGKCWGGAGAVEKCVRGVLGFPKFLRLSPHLFSPLPHPNTLSHSSPNAFRLPNTPPQHFLHLTPHPNTLPRTYPHIATYFPTHPTPPPTLLSQLPPPYTSSHMPHTLSHFPTPPTSSLSLPTPQLHTFPHLPHIFPHPNTPPPHFFTHPPPPLLTSAHTPIHFPTPLFRLLPPHPNRPTHSPVPSSTHPTPFYIKRMYTMKE